MEFFELLDRIVDFLQHRQRVSYRALKLQFALDDDALEAVKAELIDVQQCAVDERGTILVWTGRSATVLGLTGDDPPTPLAYTPPHLVEKIFTGRRGLAGERKQVTVLVVDITSALEGLADRAPAEARTLLDPVFEDLHWIDTETQSLLDTLVESLPPARLLLLRRLYAVWHGSQGGSWIMLA